MRVDIILADSAQAANGKAHILGAGWNVLNGPSPTAVILFIEVPWDQTNTPFSWKLELLSGDGPPVELPGPAGPQPISIQGDVEAGRPPGLAHGTAVPVGPFACQFSPMPLEPGRYVWRVSVNGETHETWQRAFTVAKPPPLTLPPPAL